MKKIALFLVALAFPALPALLRAIPQNVGGFNNNIMEEEKWDQAPDYEEWRLDGAGRDGRAPAAGDPAPQHFANSKPLNVFGIEAPAGAARLTVDGEKWESVEVKTPARRSDDFHLLRNTLKAETGKEIAVAGSKPERALTATVGKLRVDVREMAAGGLDVTISRAASAAVSDR